MQLNPDNVWTLRYAFVGLERGEVLEEGALEQEEPAAQRRFTGALSAGASGDDALVAWGESTPKESVLRMQRLKLK